MGKSRDAFRTISEVSEWLDTPAHVLRFWESKFTQIKPVKRAGGRRYYRPVDMELLGGIKKLLHDDGMTIKGAQKLLREMGVKHVASLGKSLTDAEQTAPEPQTDDVIEGVPAVSETKPQAEDREIAAIGDLFSSIPANVSEPPPQPEPIGVLSLISRGDRNALARKSGSIRPHFDNLAALYSRMTGN